MMKVNRSKLASEKKVDGVQIELEFKQKTYKNATILFNFEEFRKNKSDLEYYRKVEESVKKLKEKYY